MWLRGSRRPSRLWRALGVCILEKRRKQRARWRACFCWSVCSHVCTITRPPGRLSECGNGDSRPWPYAPASYAPAPSAQDRPMVDNVIKCMSVYLRPSRFLPEGPRRLCRGHPGHSGHSGPLSSCVCVCVCV
ncbi:hypothetical protein P154DRAFT_268034 [Amniculicola lignicola CBS 123094]|uniref:Uncharacterized protein n=1 Tax=Amniculicola lignicola CBS 123094 TaxID=1392246 RepID=A0A6A5W9J6_9PLEO|nr:hypothetical protein P154DRAFT_268034 [Amniculicola lignicola CBS 123094]